MPTIDWRSNANLSQYLKFSRCCRTEFSQYYAPDIDQLSKIHIHDAFTILQSYAVFGQFS